MKKRFKGAGIVVGVAACIAGIYFYWNGAEERALIEEVDGKSSSEVRTEIDKSFKAETPEQTMAEYEKYSEGQLIQEVHEMSHQKVQADQKWGASEIAEDKIQKLLEVIQSKEFKNKRSKDMLLAILGPWAQGNFSNAVSAHNQIWNSQNGNVGKATRLLTPKEELKYIEENFR